LVEIWLFDTTLLVCTGRPLGVPGWYRDHDQWRSGQEDAQMATDPDVPAEADSEQLDKSGEAINEAKAAASRAVRDESIDMPTTEENVPSAPPATEAGDET
jgi:hypothetical protein